MTLPTTYILPEMSDSQDTKEYLQDLVFELQNMYENVAYNLNGSIRTYAEVDGSEWVPTISSTGVQGTIGYTLQCGYSRRSGILTEIWFDIAWESIGAATGTIIVDLPYKTSTYAGNSPAIAAIPFTNPIITERLIYAPSTTVAIAADSNSYNGRLVKSGSGIPNTLGLAIQSVGRIRGYLKYIGVEDE